MSIHLDALDEVRARRAVQQLTDLGVPIPKPVAAALERLDKLAEAAPREPSIGDIADGYLAGDGDATERAASARVLVDVLRQGHGRAMQIAGRAVSDTIRGAGRNEIAKHLADLAGAHAAQVDAADALGEETTLEALVQAGRFEDAAVLSAAPAHRATLNRLHSWAGNHLGGGIDLPAAAAAAG